MKKKLVVILSVIFALSLSIAYAGTYADIEGNQYAKAIEDLSQMDIISGYEDGTFKPEKSISRAEMAKLLGKILKEDNSNRDTATINFVDVPKKHWATEFISIAAKNGLVKGDGNGYFRPDDTVTYAETVTMVIRMLGYTEVENSEAWPNNYIDKANELKILDSVTLSSYSENANRGAVAQILSNATKIYYSKEELEILRQTYEILNRVEQQQNSLLIFAHNSKFKSYLEPDKISKEQLLRLIQTIKISNEDNKNHYGEYFGEYHVSLIYNDICDNEKFDAYGKLICYGCTAAEESEAEYFKVSIFKENEKGLIKEIRVESLDNNLDYFVLCDGQILDTTPGKHIIRDMQINDISMKKYNTTYYNYENNKYVGTSEGDFGEVTFDGVSVVKNVSKFAFSKKFDAIPRKMTKCDATKLINNYPGLKEVTSVEVFSVDLNGDGKLEYILCIKDDVKGDEEHIRAYSEISLLDSNYGLISGLAYLEDGFLMGMKNEENKTFIGISNVECLDIDNDGIMEIIIDHMGIFVYIYKYDGTELKGKGNISLSARL